MLLKHPKTYDMTSEQIGELLAGINRFSLLKREEELTLLRAVKAKGGVCIEMKQLEESNMRFVVSLIKQYLHSVLTLEELIEAGKVGLRKAAENYDLDSNTVFIVYAVTQMRPSIKDAITKNLS